MEAEALVRSKAFLEWLEIECDGFRGERIAAPSIYSICAMSAMSEVSSTTQILHPDSIIQPGDDLLGNTHPRNRFFRANLHILEDCHAHSRAPCTAE